MGRVVWALVPVQTCSGGGGGGRQCGPSSKWECEDTRSESEGSTLERPAGHGLLCRGRSDPQVEKSGRHPGTGVSSLGLG